MTNLVSTFLLSESVILAISFKSIVAAAAVLGITGLIIGVLLGIAAKVFYVKEDEREAIIRELLPGVNCGGCGYAGCDALAKAIVNEDARTNACPVADKEANTKISEIMGKTVEEEIRKVAFVKCNGTCDKTVRKYEYYGSYDCKRATAVPGRGEKECAYSCMGYGTCVRACMFEAIKVVDGCAVVDKEKCTGCNVCVAVCPNHVIELLPYTAKHIVQCSNHEKGKEVRAVCAVGCIGCKICVKQCAYDAIHVENNLAYIDPEKCTNCGKCAEKCPQKIIT